MSEDEITVELTTKQVGVISLSLGLLIGGLVGFIAGGSNMPTQIIHEVLNITGTTCD